MASYLWFEGEENPNSGRGARAEEGGNGTWSFNGSAINPPLGIGTYDVTVTATDLAGNTASDPGNNALTIQADVPTASLNAPNVTTDGASTYTFTVTYQSSVGIDITGLDNQDIRVTGPNGFDQAAQFISVNTPSNGSPRIATYRINTPGGAWDVADNGSYTFTYDSGYYNDNLKPGISLTMPKTQLTYTSEHLFPYFYNMISEGTNRVVQSKQLRIDEKDYFGLLLATAQYDTIGAITVKQID